MPAFSGNVYCIGRNYQDHAQELNNPVPTEPIIFLKSPAALRAFDEPGIAFANEVFAHEVELVLLLEKDPAKEWSKVAAISLGIDVTRREVQTSLKTQGLPWTKAKSFKGSGILSPFVAVDRFPDRDNIKFSLHVGGSLKQEGQSRDMIFSIPHLIAELALFHDFEDGDLVFTGTPSGVGSLRAGDAFRLTFGDLGISYEGKV
jgi:2-keto-4-pentenoate hydratase/2-oxohepta-3-ene-1,7-dioic acid hydratase in catechol pathway